LGGMQSIGSLGAVNVGNTLAQDHNTAYTFLITPVSPPLCRKRLI
jgi:hypothetical protein